MFALVKLFELKRRSVFSYEGVQNVFFCTNMTGSNYIRRRSNRYGHNRGSHSPLVALNVSEGGVANV